MPSFVFAVLFKSFVNRLTGYFYISLNFVAGPSKFNFAKFRDSSFNFNYLYFAGISSMSVGVGRNRAVLRYFLRPLGLQVGNAREMHHSKRKPLCAVICFGALSKGTPWIMNPMIHFEIAQLQVSDPMNPCPRVLSFGMIQIRISDPRSPGSWCMKRTRFYM